MTNELYPPIFVLELETADFNVFRDANSLRLFVEEFWDILVEDFKIWDSSGFLLSFDSAFLEKKNGGIHRKTPNDLVRLKQLLNNYAKKNRIDIVLTDDSSMEDIAIEIDKLAQ